MKRNTIQILSTLVLILALGLSTATSQAATIQVSNQNFEESLNKAIIDAQTGDTIQMPEGRFSMSNELLINKPGLILRGQGPAKTILSFKNQKAGPQGILGTKNQLVLSNFAVEDTAGNAIKVVGSNGVIFDKLRITWTGGPNEKNGSYGIYPVLTKNVLIQDCDVSGASDAGLYVGQSDHIIVRRNYVHGNVAGLEIENSSNADVYENRATQNTVGLLVFNLPDLLVKTGQNIRFYKNQSNDNNLENFSTPGSIINLVPKGAGMLILAAQYVEIFENEFLKNKLTGISINNYLISERKITDAQYDPMPKGIHIFNNRISKGSLPLPDFKIPDLSKLSLDSLKLSASGRTTLIFKLLLGPITPSIITDGIMDGTYAGAQPTNADQICIYGNVDEINIPANFGNLHLDSPNKIFGIPAGPATRDQGPHRCVLQRLAAVQLPEMQIEPGHEPRPTPEEINSFCKVNSSGAEQVNLAALVYDCPMLSDYNLFKNANQATVEPNSNGFNFKPSSELFTDYSEKSRYVFVPQNQKINFNENGTFDYPIGSVLAKTFSVRVVGASKQFILKPIETRLLIKRETGWVPLNYVWDAKAETASLKYGGEVITMTTLPQGATVPVKIDYHIPNLRQCSSCHNVNDQILPLGFKPKFLNWAYQGATSTESSNQLMQMQEHSLLSGLPQDLTSLQTVPSWWDVTLPKENRVKAYLDINCSHCHNPQGNARNTGLFLTYNTPTNSRAYGVCKTPAAAGIGSGGHKFAIQPGSADESVLTYRMKQSHLAVKMPQLGRSVVHQEAVGLISSWINEMPKQNCETK